MYGEYCKHAALVEEFALEKSEGETCFVAVKKAGEWPSLVVAQRFQPCVAGFDPGVLLVPETGVVFIGAGERLLAFSLDRPQKLWEDTADCGFWSWQQHGNFVLMSAELELAAWDMSGKKLWTTMVEPPWTLGVEGRRIHLDVMGKLYDFGLAEGPTRPTMG
jgi:hypothetical protein